MLIPKGMEFVCLIQRRIFKLISGLTLGTQHSRSAELRQASISIVAPIMNLKLQMQSCQYYGPALPPPSLTGKLQKLLALFIKRAILICALLLCRDPSASPPAKSEWQNKGCLWCLLCRWLQVQPGPAAAAAGRGEEPCGLAGCVGTHWGHPHCMPLCSTGECKGGENTQTALGTLRQDLKPRLAP